VAKWPEFPHIDIGSNVYANFDCILLDGGGITIGDNVLLGPRVSIYTTNHALDPEQRAAGACIAKQVVIDDDVWVGGVTINPGVRIGRGSVIGSGSVLTRSVPDGSVAAGVPAGRWGGSLVVSRRCWRRCGTRWARPGRW
jgi:maltose O-acetyltransferase